MEDFEEYLSKETSNLTEQQKEKLKKSAEYNSYLLNKKFNNFKNEVISVINSKFKIVISKIKQLFTK